ncbi:Alpha/Beta hydrolase protein [Mucidula mucida]|nr:Alpha/Beta hydrolase protein [Mucidula mucida]
MSFLKASALRLAIPCRARYFRSISTGRPHFPCVDAHAQRESQLRRKISSAPKTVLRDEECESGPEPPYARPNPTTYTVYHHASPMPLAYGSSLHSFDVAYETWGNLSPAKDNVILLHTGLSASSHAASTALNPTEGWWEKHESILLICTNVLGGCYGSTGPASIDPTTGRHYATNFPILSVFDMVRAQFYLLDHLGIDKLYASVGCSMGAMQSLAAGWLHPERVGKVVSISGTARSSPSAVAMRYAQRSGMNPLSKLESWLYYDTSPPHTGMKLARQIATITYRSGPEWDQRFGRQLKTLRDSQPSQSWPRQPALCPDFLIETYLDHQGEQFCLKYDANSLIYISKAMDLFDMTEDALKGLQLQPILKDSDYLSDAPMHKTSHSKSHPPPTHPPPYLNSLAKGMKPLAKIPVLVLGVQSDILFTVEQQREVADALRMAGNDQVVYYELGGVWGHDTFLLDVLNVGSALRGFLS